MPYAELYAQRAGYARVGLTTPGGVAIPDSATPSSCSVCLRERCFGSATTPTMIAATTINPHQSKKGSVASLPLADCFI